MNFYKRYPGDYMGKTAHLSLIEHGAYNVLLDHCYSQETPLPKDKEACYRIARAFNQIEKSAVDSILTQYFKLENEGYTHNRVKKEIAFATAQAERNKANGKLGGRPKETEVVIQKEPKDNPSGFQNETQNKGNPDYQTTRLPETIVKTTRHQTPEKNKPVFVLPEWVDSELWNEWMEIRKKLKAVNTVRAMESLIDKLFAISQGGISVNTAIKTAIEKSWKSIELDWLKNPTRGKKDGYAEFLERHDA